MRRPERPFGEQDSAGERTLYLAIELSNRQWRQDQKDARGVHHEQLRLKEERTAHCARINPQLVTPGIDLKVRSDFRQRLEQLTGWDGSALGTDLRAELAILHHRGPARLHLHQRLQQATTPRSPQDGCASVRS